MRGQVSAFAIVGVLMLIGVLALIWVTRGPNTNVQTTPLSIELESCIEGEALDTIRTVALAGGIHPDAEPTDGVWKYDASSQAAALGLNTLGTHDVRVAIIGWQPITDNDYKDWPTQAHYFDTTDTDRKLGDIVFTNLRELHTALIKGFRDGVTSCGIDLGFENVNLESATFAEDAVQLETSIIEDGRSPRTSTVVVPVPIQRYHRILFQTITRDNTDPEYQMSTVGSGQDYFIRSVPLDKNTLVVLESDQPYLGTEPLRYAAVIYDRPPVFTEDPVTVLVCTPTSVSVTSGDIDEILFDPDDLQDVSISCNQDSTETTYKLASNGETYDITIPVVVP